MTTNTQRHPFLEDLADDVVLVTSVLRKPVIGKEFVLKVVKAGAQQYKSQTPKFLGSVGERTYSEYEVELQGGQKGQGIVSILRDGVGKVTALHIAFSPLSAVDIIADGVRNILAEEFDGDFFN